MAPGVAAGSGAGAAANRPERRSALLAIRPAGTQPFHPGLHGSLRRQHRQGFVQCHKPASVLGDRRRARHRPPATVQFADATSDLAAGAGDNRTGDLPVGPYATSPPVHRYKPFRRYEGNPHGTAHVSFTGSISQIPTAAKDPLFFCFTPMWTGSGQVAVAQSAIRRQHTSSSSPGAPLGTLAPPGLVTIGRQRCGRGTRARTAPRAVDGSRGTMPPRCHHRSRLRPPWHR